MVSREDSFEALSPVTSAGAVVDSEFKHVAVGGRVPWLVPMATEQFASAQ